MEEEAWEAVKREWGDTGGGGNNERENLMVETKG